MGKFLKTAVVFLGLFVAAILGKFVAGSVFSGSGISEASIEKQLLAEDIKLFHAIKSNFPDEFRVMISKFKKVIDEGGDNNRIRMESSNETTRIRRKYSENIQFSRDDDLKKIIMISTDLHNTILEKEGARNCNKLAIGGPAAIGNIVPDYLKEFDEQAAAVIEAIGYATKNPGVPNSDILEDDWERLENRMVEMGFSRTYLDLIANPDPENPDLCPALMAMNAALLEMPGDVGRRLRVAVVTAIVGS